MGPRHNSDHYMVLGGLHVTPNGNIPAIWVRSGGSLCNPCKHKPGRIIGSYNSSKRSPSRPPIMEAERVDICRDLAPGQHESVGTKIAPERSAPYPRTGEEGMGMSEDGPKTPRSDGRVRGGGHPCFGYLSCEGGMNMDVRLVP